MEGVACKTTNTQTISEVDIEDNSYVPISSSTRTLNYSFLIANLILFFEQVGATRKAVAIAYDQRCMDENVTILEKVVCP